MMLQLGGYQFRVDRAAYETARRTWEHRWASQPRIGRTVARQYLGPGEQSMELEGTIYPHFAGGVDQVAAMAAEADTGEPRMLVDGRGNILGRWVILRLEETQRVMWRHGVPRRVDFRVELGLYGEDGA